MRPCNSICLSDLSRIVGRVHENVTPASWASSPHHSHWPPIFTATVTHTHPPSTLHLSLAALNSLPRTWVDVFTCAQRTHTAFIILAESFSVVLALLQITESLDNVISLETPVESLGITGKALYYHLSRVLQERDMYIEVCWMSTIAVIFLV